MLRLLRVRVPFLSRKGRPHDRLRGRFEASIAVSGKGQASSAEDGSNRHQPLVLSISFEPTYTENSSAFNNVENGSLRIWFRRRLLILGFGMDFRTLGAHHDFSHYIPDINESGERTVPK